MSIEYMNERRQDHRLNANDVDNMVNRIYEATPELVGDFEIERIMGTFDQGMISPERAIMELRVQEVAYHLSQLRPGAD